MSFLQDDADAKVFISEWPVISQDSVALNHVNGQSVCGSRRTTHRSSENSKKARLQVSTNCAAAELLARGQGQQLDDYETADAALAKWWKRSRSAAEPMSQTCSARTMIKRISRSEEGKEFLSQRVAQIQQVLLDNPDNGLAHASLSSFFHKLEKSKDALKHLNKAQKCGILSNEFLWKEEILRRQVQSEETRDMTDLSKCYQRMPDSKQVERRAAADLSVSEFFFKYCLRQVPLVITGGVDIMLQERWTLDLIKQVAGLKQVCLKHLVNDSMQWARLEQSTCTTVGKFIDSVCGQNASCDYLFDWSLPLHCPELLSQLVIPKYFAGDFLQRVAPGSLYRDSWPSLFIAANGVNSELHIDTFGSNFWMAMLQGKKRWTLFSPADKNFLYPDYDDSLDPVFQVDLRNPDLSAFPLLSLTHPQQCVLEPGDLLFVPSGCAHRVENLTLSLAISANFVDLSNFPLVKKELHYRSLVDPNAQELLHQFDDLNFPSKMFSKQTDLSWERFKKWPRHDYNVYDIT